MGRPKTPTAINKIRGNPGKRPAARNEPKPRTRVKKPANFAKQNPTLNRMWNRLAPEMEEINLLTQLDQMAFLIMLRSYDIATDAAAEMKAGDGYNLTRKDESGVERKHPMLQVWRDQSAQFLTFAREFGLTPASRARIGVDIDKKLDDMEAMLALMTGKSSDD